MIKSIELDVCSIENLQVELDGFGLRFDVIEMKGPGGGNPLVNIIGSEEGIEAYLVGYAEPEEFDFFKEKIVDHI